MKKDLEPCTPELARLVMSGKTLAKSVNFSDPESSLSSMKIK